MLSNKIKTILFSAMIFVLASPFASATTSPNPIEVKILGVSLKERLGRAIEFLLGITGSLALLFVIASGVFFIASNGNPDSQKKAKRMLIGSLTGLILVLFSFAFVALTDYFLVQ